MAAMIFPQEALHLQQATRKIVALCEATRGLSNLSPFDLCATIIANQGNLWGGGMPHQRFRLKNRPKLAGKHGRRYGART
jgi:hypothetical protein